MKKLFYIQGLILILATFCSCKKLLDIKPVNSMTPVSIKDYESVLLGGYPRSDFFFKTELMTDNAYANLSSGNDPLKDQEPWFTWASNMLLNGVQQDPYWGNLYKSIFYANTILDNFATRQPGVDEKELFEKVKGEAYALRAFSYFYLVNFYAEPYAQENLQAPGVPMPLTAVDVKTNATNNVREPLEKVWKQIIDDLNESSKLLAGKSGDSRFRFNSNIVDLFKARVHLFMGDYANAIATATSVMGASQLTNLNGIQPYIDSKGNTYAFSGNFGFIDTDYNKEILFFMGGKANFNLFYYGRATFKPTTELLELTKRYGNLTDYRQYIFDSFAVPNTADGVQSGPTMYNMYAKQEKDSYYIGFKVSEAYVIRAEAYARSGKSAEAISDLNTLLKTRVKAGVWVPLKAVDFTATTLLARVLEERRLEVSFDAGLRWMDLRRLGKPEISHSYKNGIIYTLKKNDPKYLLQIPPSEYNNSPNMPLNPR